MGRRSSPFLLINKKLPMSLTDTFVGNDPRWIGATWSGGVNTPTLGAELLTDGGLENWTTPTNLTSWGETVVGSSTITQDQVNQKSGSNCAKFTVVSGQNIEILQAITYNSAWASIKCYAKILSGTGNIFFANGGTSLLGFPLTAEYTLYGATFRSSTNSINIKRSGAGNFTFVADDATSSIISIPTLFRLQRFATPYGTTKSAWTITSGLQAGVVANLDNPSNPKNFVICYHNGSNLLMEKCVAGTYTTLVNSAATYGAGRLVEIRRAAGTNTYQAFYNNAQVGTDQTISDAGIINNTYHGMMSTGAANTAASFTFAGA